MLTKPVALAWTLGLTLAFGLPGIRHALPDRFAAADSFPVSTFPMFSMPRPPEHRMTWVRALDREGKSLGPVPSYYFYLGGMNQAGQHLKQARPNDRARRAAVCAEIAGRIAKSRALRSATEIEIVDAYYVPAKVFGPERDETPARERRLVRCALPERKR